MLKTERRTLLKEFDLKYKNPNMRLNLEEQGWKYVRENKGKLLFKIFY
jgi:transposase